MKVKLILAPSGGNCRHVHITDLQDKLLDIMTRDDFGREDEPNDRPIPRRVLQSARRYLAANPGATPAQIRTAIEADEL